MQKGEWGGVFGVWCLVPGITGPNTKLQTPNSKRLVVIWRAAMTRGQMAAVLQLLGLRHYFRRPRRPLQVYLAASFGHCRAVWRQVLAAAGLSGGNWLLQGRCTSPSFNGAAVKYFLLSSSLLFSSCLVLNKNKKYYRVAMSIHIFYIVIADARLEVVEKRSDQSLAFTLFKAMLCQL